MMVHLGLGPRYLALHGIRRIPVLTRRWLPSCLVAGFAFGPLLVGCFDPGPFNCDSNAQCAGFEDGATCEPLDKHKPPSAENVGFCSFNDVECGSGHRYESYANELAGVCVACGALDEYCCGTGGACDGNNTCARSTCSCVVRVTAMQERTCVLKADGTVWCWGVIGSNVTNPTQSTAIVPVQLPGVDQVVDLVLGSDGGCVRRADATLLCWHQFPEPVPEVAPLGGGVHMAVGDSPTVFAGQTLCVLYGDGVVKCTESTAPSTTMLDGAIQLAGKRLHFCALKRDQTVWCWGSNRFGQLGDGTLQDRATPVRVSGLPPVAEVSVGLDYTCARTMAGAVFCWGADRCGSLGDGKNFVDGINHDRATPGLVDGVHGATQLVLGDTIGCVGDKDGRLVCWGTNCGLATGTADSTGLPTLVNGVSVDSEVAIGSGHGCARHGSKISCWGSGGLGPLSQGDVVDRLQSPPAALFSCE